MTEIASLKQLANWLNQRTNPRNTEEIISRVKEYVIEDVQEMLGNEGKVAISVVEQDERSRPQLFVDQVFPWNFDNIDLEQSRKMNKLSSAFAKKVQIPLLLLHINEVRIHGWNMQGDSTEEELLEYCRMSRRSPVAINDDNSVEIGKEGRAERFFGLVSPRMLQDTT